MHDDSDTCTELDVCVCVCVCIVCVCVLHACAMDLSGTSFLKHFLTSPYVIAILIIIGGHGTSTYVLVIPLFKLVHMYK